jgi:hypothetical protein
MQEYDWKSFSFGAGAHDTRDDGMCVMEAVAYIADELHSDHPKCACPVLSAFCRSWNDKLESDEERAKWLSEFVWRLPGTKSTPEIELRRSEMAYDWLVREYLPSFLELSPNLIPYAINLRGLPWITSRNFELAVPVINAAVLCAGLRWRSCAGAAAVGAAGAAVGAAVGAVGAGAAAVAGAGAAVAAGAAAGAGVEITPTVEKLKQSAHDLLDRMVSLTEIKENVIEKTNVGVVVHGNA